MENNMKMPNMENIGEVSTQVRLRETGTIDLTNQDYQPRKYGTNELIQEVLQDDKAYVRYIKGIVQTVRKQIEYKSYIKFLHGEVELTESALLKGVGVDNQSIEIHHAIFSLWDIVDIVTQSYIKDNKPFQQLSIANEVMECHYKNMVALVPLDITTHELVHSGELFIKFDHIFGDIRQFIEKYQLGLRQEHIEMLNIFVKLNADPTVDKKNQYNLSVKPITWLDNKSFQQFGLITFKSDLVDEVKKEKVVKQDISELENLSERIILK